MSYCVNSARVESFTDSDYRVPYVIPGPAVWSG